jgi:sugar phosphate isomerase/epimerase
MKLLRRKFVQTAAGLLMATVTPSWLRAAAGRKGPNLGFSLYGMKSMSLEDSLRECARIGYRNVELCIDTGFPAEPAKFSSTARRALKQQAESLGLTFSGLMLNLNLADPALHAGNLDLIKSAAQLAHDLVPGAPPPIETVSRGKPPEWDALKDGMLARVKEWGDTAASAKITIVIKAHFNMAVSTPARLLWLLENANRKALRVAYDYSHFELQDIGMAESWRALGSRTDFVHVKDTAGDAKKATLLLPGEGRTDYVALFEMLKQSGYHGPVVVEVSSQIFSRPDYQPVVAAEKSYAALARAAAAVK